MGSGVARYGPQRAPDLARGWHANCPLMTLALPVLQEIAAVEYHRRTPEDSLLYRMVQQNLETFLAEAAARDRCVPTFVEREFRKFLACGLLCHGFVRVRCKDCGDEKLVAFSCQRRGFCPSCCGCRMAAGSHSDPSACEA